MKEKLKEVKNCCYECGVTANVITCLVKYHNVPKQIKTTLSTYHEGKCDYCKKTKGITETRDFFHPNFNLLKGVIDAYKKLQNEKRKY